MNLGIQARRFDAFSIDLAQIGEPGSFRGAASYSAASPSASELVALLPAVDDYGFFKKGATDSVFLAYRRAVTGTLLIDFGIQELGVTGGGGSGIPTYSYSGTEPSAGEMAAALTSVDDSGYFKKGDTDKVYHIFRHSSAAGGALGDFSAVAMSNAAP